MGFDFQIPTIFSKVEAGIRFPVIDKTNISRRGAGTQSEYGLKSRKKRGINHKAHEGKHNPIVPSFKKIFMLW